VWNFCLLVFLYFYTKRKKFDGEIFLLYLMGYGFARFFIEGLRTDQLKLFGTGLAASQLLSALLVFGALCAVIYKHIRLSKLRR
jgi:phosphatidylglycerol:prolipoprotein diacylglycerol transferase